MTYKNKKTNATIQLKKGLKPKDVFEYYQDWVNIEDCLTLDKFLLEFGDVFFTVDQERFKVYKASFGITFQNNQKWDLRFKEKENADWWIKENKPSYNLLDVERAVNNWAMMPMDTLDIFKFFEREK